jgi:hypothetical protein
MTRIDLGALLLLTLALSMGAADAAHAAESYDNCTGFITSVPATITSQGTWCLKQNLATAITSGNAITINTNNVTVDCNDFKIDGLSAGLATQAYGIYADTRLNVTVRRCDVRGFRAGILLLNNGGTGGGHVVEDSVLDGNTRIGVSISGDGSVVRNNRIFNTGGSTVVSSALGIYAGGSVDVMDNLVSGVTATVGGNDFADGIYTYGNINGSVARNRVRGVQADGTGVATAIENGGSGRLSMRGNEISGNAAAGSLGITCTNASGRLRDSTINGFASGFVNCTDDGGNVIRL